ncbi:MAG: hypothetical protein RSA51_07260 [Niameybacter sp.]
MKQIKTGEMRFEFEIGSNIVYVNGEKTFLDIVVWDEVTYEAIEKHICQ